jgi:hypothetical protein
MMPNDRTSPANGIKKAMSNVGLKSQKSFSAVEINRRNRWIWSSSPKACGLTAPALHELNRTSFAGAF